MTRRRESVYYESLSEWLEGHESGNTEKLVLEAPCAGLLATSEYDRASTGELLSFLRQAVRRMAPPDIPGGLEDRSGSTD